MEPKLLVIFRISSSLSPPSAMPKAAAKYEGKCFTVRLKTPIGIGANFSPLVIQFALVSFGVTNYTVQLITSQSSRSIIDSLIN